MQKCKCRWNTELSCGKIRVDWDKLHHRVLNLKHSIKTDIMRKGCGFSYKSSQKELTIAKQTQEHKPHIKSHPLTFSRFLWLRAASRWVQVIWKGEVAIATTHTTCSPFSIKKRRRGNSAFSPSICLASCLHAWCSTLSEFLKKKGGSVTKKGISQSNPPSAAHCQVDRKKEESGRSDRQTKTRCVIKLNYDHRPI